jgi:hypothetical protein
MPIAAEQIGIVAAGLVALTAAFALARDAFSAWFSRPRLDLTLALAPPDCHKAHVRAGDWSHGTVAAALESSGPGGDEAIEVYRLRLRVANRGRREAEDVAVFVSGLARQEASGAFRPVDWFLPTNLSWTNFQWLVFPAIEPGHFRHCDLAYVARPEAIGAAPADPVARAGPGPAGSALRLATAAEPRLPSRPLLPGTYRLRVAAVPFAGRPARRTMEISLSGEWFDDEREMLARGVSVRPLE